jgi:ubiquinone biosynthesis protein
MTFIKTSLNITKSIRSMGRLKEIVSVLAKNGFEEFITNSDLLKYIPNFVIPKRESLHLDSDNQSGIGIRLRISFEELGPCFIKIGQLLSTREDIFDSLFIDEMKKLLDQTTGIEFHEAISSIEKSFGTKWENIFESIDKNPLGNASIAHVYKGRLKTGEEVVIKLQRPGIKKVVETDLSLINFLVEKFELYFKDLKYLGISRIVNDFSKHLKRELDFQYEALNAQKLKVNIEKWDDDKVFYLPIIYTEYCRNDIIVMEYLDGIAFANKQKILPYKHIVKDKLISGVHVFIDSLLKDGLFHADLHGGNFFLLKNSKIGVIDFGLMGTLEKRGRTNLLAILNFLVTYNYENLIYEFLDVAEYEEIPDINVLIRDIRDGLGPFIGLTVQQTNFSLLLKTIMKILADHRIYLPSEWFVLFRALMTLDGVGKSLGIDFDIFNIIEKNVMGSSKDLFSKEDLLNEGVWVTRDILTSLRFFPRHLKWFLREFSKNNYSFQVINKGYEDDINYLGKSIQFLGLMILSSILLITGAVTIENKNQLSVDSLGSYTMIFWTLSFMIFLFSFRLLKKKNN